MSETKRIIDIIKQGAEGIKKEELDKLLDAGRKAKPAGYDSHQRKVRKYYEGNQKGSLKSVLAKRYPKTHQKMTPVCLNIVKPAAELDAQCYRQEPERWIEINGERPGEEYIDDDGEKQVKLEKELPRQERFQEVIRISRLRHVLAEAERRCMAAKTIFGRVAWDKTYETLGYGARIKIDLFWPADVWVIPNPSAPSCLWAAYGLIAKIQSESDDDEDWYEVWTRAFSQSGDDVSVGPWIMEQVSTKGRSRGLITYPLPDLPWFVMTDGMTNTSCFHDIERDLVEQQDAVNVGLTNWWYKDDMQGHGQVVITGHHQRKGQDMVGGPGAVWFLDEGAVAQVLNHNHDMTTMQGLEKNLRMLGITRRQSPDAWATEPGPPLSGVSRIVQNIAPNEKREERMEQFQENEEEWILRILIGIADTWGTTYLGGTIGGSGVQPRVRFQEPKQYEEPEAKRLRARNMEVDGWISSAHAAVMGGGHRTLNDAKLAGLSDTIQPWQSSMTAGVEQGVQVDTPTTTEMNEYEEAGPASKSDLSEVTLNELSLTVERAARVGDMKLLNAARRELMKRLGIGSADVTVQALSAVKKSLGAASASQSE